MDGGILMVAGVLAVVQRSTGPTVKRTSVSVRVRQSAGHAFDTVHRPVQNAQCLVVNAQLSMLSCQRGWVVECQPRAVAASAVSVQWRERRLVHSSCM